MQYSLTGIKSQLAVFLKTFANKLNLIKMLLRYSAKSFVTAFLSPLFNPLSYVSLLLLSVPFSSFTSVLILLDIVYLNRTSHSSRDWRMFVRPWLNKMRVVSQEIIFIAFLRTRNCITTFTTARLVPQSSTRNPVKIPVQLPGLSPQLVASLFNLFKVIDSFFQTPSWRTTSCLYSAPAY